jgi:nitrogen fixation protein NifB
LDAADVLISNQMAGILKVIKAGLSLKVNSVLIPGVNDKHMVPLARQLKDMGVKLMNIMPLIPSGKMKHFSAPECEDLRNIRLACEAVLPQFWWCKQCSADIVHFPPQNPRGGN